jgi:diguanylate cyclase (GGDEF)-like protein/PAS domain S-box-containing protein
VGVSNPSQPADELARAGQEDLLFERACHHAAIGICLLDPSGKFLRVNPTLCKILGRSEAELLGMDFATVTHPADLAESLRLHDDVTHRGHDTKSLETRYLTGSGDVTWSQTTISVVRDPATGTPRVLIAQVQDITARKEAEQQLRRTREEFRLLAETSTDLISRHEPDGTYLYVSPAARPLLGYEPEELLGRSLFDQVHPEDHSELERSHAALLSGGSSFTCTYRFRRKNGTWAWFETSARLVRIADDDGEPGRVERMEIHASSRDVTGRKRAEERIRDLARRLEEANRHLKQANLSLKEIAATDPLTGLGNRRAFEGRLGMELRRASRSGGPLSLLYLDLDRFKGYNDRYGHLAGDELLIKLGALLSDSVRTSDSVARIGGEEFVVLLPETDEEGASTLGEKLRRVVAERLAGRRPVTLSVGAATIEVPHDSSPDLDALSASLLQTADSALYEAKRAGRNRVVHAAAGERV